MEMLNVILIPALIIGGIALLLGLILSIASLFFGEKPNEKETAVRECLPGANCGGCGFAGCDEYAKAIAEGKAEPNLCAPGGADTAKKISAVLGVNTEIKIKKAVVLCNGNSDNCDTSYNYIGSRSCNDAISVLGGPKACKYGCIGFGDCVNACAFNALSIENGKAKVNTDNCTGCGKCANICPKGIISLFEYPFKTINYCSNKDKGALARKVCKTACIGCGICLKNCNFNAIKIENNKAEVITDNCTNCKACVEKCPMHCIN